jgi:hypothetical protein
MNQQTQTPPAGEAPKREGDGPVRDAEYKEGPKDKDNPENK